MATAHLAYWCFPDSPSLWVAIFSPYRRDYVEAIKLVPAAKRRYDPAIRVWYVRNDFWEAESVLEGIEIFFTICTADLTSTLSNCRCCSVWEGIAQRADIDGLVRGDHDLAGLDRLPSRGFRQRLGLDNQPTPICELTVQDQIQQITIPAPLITARARRQLDYLANRLESDRRNNPVTPPTPPVNHAPILERWSCKCTCVQVAPLVPFNATCDLCHTKFSKVRMDVREALVKGSLGLGVHGLPIDDEV